MGSPPFDVRRLSVNFYIQSYFTLCFSPGLKLAIVDCLTTAVALCACLETHFIVAIWS